MIAEAFHRTGAVEVWGRGTNRVIEMCQQHGAPPPIFKEKQGFVVVTFRAPLVVGGARGSSGAESGAQVGTKSDQVEILRLCREAQPLVAMMEVVGRNNRTKVRDGLIKPLIEAALLELTIPDKPRSRMQRYKTTGAGLEAAPFARVTPRDEEKYRTCVPLLTLKAAAGAFSDPQHVEDDDWEWIAVDTKHLLRPGMFVAQVVGKSMEPAIPDGAYCLFRGTRHRHPAGQDRAARRHRPRDRRALHRQALRER